MRKLVYIMGCAHCGSTLLTGLLGRHSEITTIGELKATAIPDLPTYHCGCSELISSCTFWKQVQDICASRGTPLELSSFGTHYRAKSWLSNKIIHPMVRTRPLEAVRHLALAIYPPAHRILDQIHDKNQAIIDAVCTVENKPVFLDSSKDPTRLLHLWKSGRFDIRAIHLVRDGRAIVTSHKKRFSDLDEIIEIWKSKSEECERMKAALCPASIMTVRYEDLCQDVGGTLARLFKFIGVADEGQACTQDRNTASRHILGHNSRLNRNRDVKLREDWRSQLTQAELERIEDFAGALNRAYGYV